MSSTPTAAAPPAAAGADVLRVEPLVLQLREVRRGDVGRVGGKNASLGELLANLDALGVRVPDGFATTAAAFRHFLRHNGLDAVVAAQVARLEAGATLRDVGSHLRAALRVGTLPDDLADAVVTAYEGLRGPDGADVAVAVRSSATAEDLPEASFAGQQETFLNVVGVEAVLEAVRRCFASLFTDRAIAYRRANGFDHTRVALSVGVQRMVRSDLGAAGVMFTLDPESGFPDVVRVDGSWGLGEAVVSGEVTPDSWLVFTPLLDEPGVVPILDRTVGGKAVKVVDDERGGVVRAATTPRERAALVLDDEQVLVLARWARSIEEHYGCPMDVEWALDGLTDELFVVQARPETVRSRESTDVSATHVLEGTSPVLVEGRAVGTAVATGRVVVVHDPADDSRLRDGDVLVTERTDPDWVPLMQRASAVVTDLGGRTAHAAIVSRELGIPAIVGCGDATKVLHTGQHVTVSCAEGDTGRVHEGELPFRVEHVDLASLPDTRTKVLLNVASPAAAWRSWRLPVRGVGLLRMEFLVSQHVGVHPLAATRFDELDEATQAAVAGRLGDSEDPAGVVVERLASGIAQVAASRWPDPVVLRLSDFKTNEYADLLGGAAFEPHEENPMIGFRGASRYADERYRDGFALECRAVRRVREQVGLTNLAIMVPFVRTLDEADRVLAELAANGLARGEAGLQVLMMVEVPSNAILAERFAERFDGFSIGSNDLTQLTLGADRDSPELAASFDERDPAVLALVERTIAAAHAAGITVGICGQGPSDRPDLARRLVEMGIDSMSLNPDSVARTLPVVAAAEAAAGG